MGLFTPVISMCPLRVLVHCFHPSASPDVGFAFEAGDYNHHHLQGGDEALSHVLVGIFCKKDNSFILQVREGSVEVFKGFGQFFYRSKFGWYMPVCIGVCCHGVPLFDECGEYVNRSSFFLCFGCSPFVRVDLGFVLVGDVQKRLIPEIANAIDVVVC